jgi:type IV fimbrial biogenesis protein FimT
MSQRVPWTRSEGFTLVELMVTVSVLVIFLGIAAPSLGTFMTRNQVAAVKSLFASSMALARSEAARAGAPVILRAASGGATGNAYANGWDLYLDVDQNGSVSTGDTLLRHYEAIPPGVTLNGSTSIVFSAGGYLSPAASVTYKACRSDGATAGYSVAVAPSGVSYVSSITTCP